MAVVLSPIESRQSSGEMVFSTISSQIAIGEAMNSNRFLCARPYKFLGISSLQTLPHFEKPPKPRGQASTLYYALDSQ